VACKFLFEGWGDPWSLESAHLVQVPVAKSLEQAYQFLMFPDFSTLTNSAVLTAGVTIAAVASLETLLNLEAVDKIDKHQRQSPPNRELFAQGVGNILGGLVGAIPVTSVIVRSSVNINAGATSKLSAIFHGVLLLLSVMFIPQWLNQIPLSALAAILLITGIKLANPQLVVQMWKEGKNQFLPFFVTVVAIILSDLLIGVLIGLGTSICFILHSNIRRPIKTTWEKHAAGDEVLHIELPNQVSFFNKAALEKSLKTLPPGGHVLINAMNTDYIDPDILDLITDYQSNNAITKDVNVSLVGFKDKYPQLQDSIKYIDYSSREVQENLTPEKILEILREGNERFREGVRLTRDLGRQLTATSNAQFPMAVILSCIDSRSPVELIFDLSLGDAFSVRIAGNIVSQKILGSIEYGCAVVGAKLILVMGHTSCGAVKASVDFTCSQQSASEATGCANLDSLVSEIQECVDPDECAGYEKWNSHQKEEYLNEVAYKNVLRTIAKIRENSPTIDKLVKEGKVAIVGAMYNISTAKVSFFFTPDDSGANGEPSEFMRKTGYKLGFKEAIKKFFRKYYRG
jgi:carbonic anhydrase/SulP family sulfate permease